jgi:hypothetical protein
MAQEGNQNKAMLRIVKRLCSQKQKRAFLLLAFAVFDLCFGHLVAGAGFEPTTFGL